MSDDDQSKQDFVDEAKAKSEQISKDIQQKKVDIETSKSKEIRELKGLFADKEYKVESSLKKLEKAGDKDKDKLKEQAQKEFEAKEKVGGWLDKAVEKEKEKEKERGSESESS